MRFLVIGAGVIGSFYAGRLSSAGHEVTVLARGSRARQIAANGIVIKEAGSTATSAVTVIEQIDPALPYDAVLVAIRATQLDAVIPVARQTSSNWVVFMVNSAEGPARLIEALGSRVLLAFPGAGGTVREDGVVEATVVHPMIQMTTIGEAAGPVTPRTLALAKVFKDAGFPSTTCSRMPAWLATHVALVSPIANAIYAAGGDLGVAARSPDVLVLMVRAIKENFRALRRAGTPLTPARLASLSYVPEPLLVAISARLLATAYADLIAARHANNARDEMAELAAQMSQIARQAGAETPSADALAGYADIRVPPMAERSSSIPMHWGGMAVLAAAVSAAAAAVAYVWLEHRRQSEDEARDHGHHPGAEDKPTLTPPAKVPPQRPLHPAPPAPYTSTASMRLGPGSASDHLRASANSKSVSARRAGTPKPVASARQSITGRVRSVSASAVGPGSVTPARANSACRIR